MTPFPSSRRFFPLLAMVAPAVVAAALAGCNGSTSPDLDDRSAGEVAAALSTGVTRGFAVALADGGHVGAARPQAPGSTPTSPPAGLTPRTWSFDGTGDCPAGGTVRALGDGTVESSEREEGGRAHGWDWQARLSFASCGVFVDERTYFLTTEEDIQFTGSGQAVTAEGGVEEGSFEWSYSGTVNWIQQGGPTGTCGFSLSTPLTFQDGAAQAAWAGPVEGTICGREVSRSWRTTIQP